MLHHSATWYLDTSVLIPMLDRDGRVDREAGRHARKFRYRVEEERSVIITIPLIVIGEVFTTLGRSGSGWVTSIDSTTTS